MPTLGLLNTRRGLEVATATPPAFAVTMVAVFPDLLTIMGSQGITAGSASCHALNLISWAILFWLISHHLVFRVSAVVHEIWGPKAAVAIATAVALTTALLMGVTSALVAMQHQIADTIWETGWLSVVLVLFLIYRFTIKRFSRRLTRLLVIEAAMVWAFICLSLVVAQPHFQTGHDGLRVGASFATVLVMYAFFVGGIILDGDVDDKADAEPHGNL
jgi:hypothetical protein